MNVQYISFTGEKCYPDMICTSIENPRSLDEFDVNVIDLSHPEIWKSKYDNDDIDGFKCFSDLEAIGKMAKDKRKSEVLYIFPQNIEFQYDESASGEFQEKCPLKAVIEDIMEEALKAALPDYVESIDLCFEPTRTKIEGTKYSADFYIQKINGNNRTIRGNMIEGVITSWKSEKITVVKIIGPYGHRVFASTLDATSSAEKLQLLLRELFEKPSASALPEWLTNEEFFDDAAQKALIEAKQKAIKQAKADIEAASHKLEHNNHFKSILYENGDALVNVVFEMLQPLLDCDLSHFVDEKKEDFLIKKPQVTFIGEIKGVTSNIKSEHVSQVDVHYQGYQDELEEKGESEVIRSLLILNPFRTKPLTDREPVHQRQIELAKRNGCLIIETITLLRLYERFLDGAITAEQCIALFASKTGLLKAEDVDSIPS